MNQIIIHLSTLALNFIGLFLMKGLIISHLATYLILVGVLIGFAISWYNKIRRPPYLDLLMDTLSVSLVIWFFVELFSSEFSFLELLRTFIRLLIGLQLLHSFTLYSEKDYAFNQAITIPLVVSSITFSRENPIPYLNYYVVTFLFLWIVVLSFSLLEKKRKSVLEVIETSASDSLILLRDFGADIFLFLAIVVFSWLLFIYLPRVERPTFGIIPSIWGVPKEEKPESPQEKFPVEGLAERYPMAVLVKFEKTPQSITGIEPGPGLISKIIKEEKGDKEFDVQGRVVKYTEKGIISGKEYKMAGFNITYDQRDRVISYSEVGIYGNEPYELTRDEISYNEQGQATSYHETGTFADQPYELTRDEISYNEQGQATSYHETGTFANQPYELTRDEISYNEQGQATSYHETGTFANQPYELTRDEISYNEQGQATSYHETGTFANQPYELTRDEISYNEQGQATSYHETGTFANQPYELTRDEISYNEQGQATSYHETGTFANQPYELTRDEISYNEQGQATSYHEIGTFANQPYELTRDEISYGAQGQVVGYYGKGTYKGKEYEFTKPPPPPEIPLPPEIKKVEKPEIEIGEVPLEEKEVPGKEKSKLNLLRIILKSLLYLLLLSILLCILLLLLLYIRHKIDQRRLQILLSQNPTLFTINIYKSSSDVLRIYGCRRLNWMVPEEYLALVGEKRVLIIDNFKLLTEEFLKAKYSFHTLTTESSFLAGKNYRRAVEKLKEYGNRWQNLLAHFVRFNIRISEK